MKEIDAQFWTLFLMILVGKIKMKASEAVKDVILRIFTLISFPLNFLLAQCFDSQIQ